MKEIAVLCYVEDNWAFFTTQDLKEQWGDDWNDVPYEHNAGYPYDSNGYKVFRVAFYGELERPCDGVLNSRYSVEGINAKLIPWLKSPRWATERIEIWAGETFAEFSKKIKAAAGKIYVEA